MPEIPFQINGFLGLAKQTDISTRAARTEWYRFQTANLTAKHRADYTQSSRETAGEDANLGNYDPRLSFRVEARPENLGRLLAAWAGAASATSAQQGGTAAYKHTIKPTLTPQYLTAEKRLGTLNKSQVLDGLVITELRGEFANNFLAYSGSGPGYKDETDVAPSTATWETPRSFMKHQAVVTLGGSTYGVKSGRWVLRRIALEEDYELGSRYRKGIPIGPVEASIEIEAGLRDLTVDKRSMGGASGTNVTPQDDPLYNADQIVLTSDQNAGAGFPYKHEVILPRAHWERTEITGDGGKEIMQKLTTRALYDVATTKVLELTATNTKTSL